METKLQKAMRLKVEKKLKQISKVEEDKDFESESDIYSTSEDEVAQSQQIKTESDYSEDLEKIKYKMKTNVEAENALERYQTMSSEKSTKTGVVKIL